MRILLLFLTRSLLSLSAQEVSRLEELEAERDRKSANLQPETVSKGEAFLRDFRERKFMERFSGGTSGFGVRLGNMATGAGFAAGPQYHREGLLGERLAITSYVQGSTSLSYKMETGFTLRPWKDDRLQLYTGADHRNYNRLQFYGSGPDSSKDGRSNYRLEDTNWDAAALSRLGLLRLGGGTGYSWVNVGPGTRPGIASTDRTYGPAQAPGIDQQTNFLRTTVLAQFDYRNSPVGPRKGGNYIVQHTWFSDRMLNRYGFRRLDVQMSQYIPFFNGTRVIALRAHGTFTETDSGQVTPFYYRPFLGGSDDLRGFRPYRFNGPQMVNFNAEYRWEVFSGLDGAIFWDGGRVAERRGQLHLSELESSAGFGLRFNARNATFIRVDVGFSHEGFQVWFKFNDPFLNRAFGVSLRQPAY